MTDRTPLGPGFLDGGLVHRVPPRVCERLAARLGAPDLRQVLAARFKERSSNAWFRGTAGGREIFVKLYARADRAAADRAVSAALGAERTTRFLAGGRDEQLGEYGVFAWEELAALPWDTRAAAIAGRLLASVHDTAAAVVIDAAPQAEPAQPPEAGYARRLEGLAEQAPDLFARYRGVLTGGWARSVVAQAQRLAEETAPVLLHGDYSLRNIARAASGRELVFDFERADAGLAEEDLGRLWDRELAAIPGGREAFAAAYRAARAEDPGPPRAPALDFARLSCAVGTLAAARRTDDPEFEAEGLTILRALT